MSVSSNIAALKGTPLADDERALLTRLAQGDRNAFDDLVALHQQRITRLVYRLLGWQDAEDVVQEVFLAAWKKLGSFRGQSSLATWLTAIAIRQCRSRRRRFWLRLHWLRKAAPGPSAQPADSPVLRDELGAEVRRAVQDLPPADREVIVLYYLEQMSTKDIAGLLNTSAGAIDVRLHRARSRLRAKLTKYLEE